MGTVNGRYPFRAALGKRLLHAWPCLVPWWLTMAGGVLCLAGVAMSGSRSVRKAGPASPVAVAAEGQPR